MYYFRFYDKFSLVLFLKCQEIVLKDDWLPARVASFLLLVVNAMYRRGIFGVYLHFVKDCYTA